MKVDFILFNIIKQVAVNVLKMPNAKMVMKLSSMMDTGENLLIHPKLLLASIQMLVYPLTFQLAPLDMEAIYVILVFSIKGSIMKEISFLNVINAKVQSIENLKQ